MKIRNMVNTIISFGLVLILFITLPVFATKAQAAENLEATLNVSSQSIVKGKTFNLRVYNLCEGQTVTYKSSQTNVATVSSTGCVTGVSTGTAVITATVKDGLKTVSTLSCNIKVGPPAITVRITPSTVTLAIGQKKTLNYVIFPKNSVELPRYLSNNEKVVSVSAGGRITGKSVGTTWVFCTLENGNYGWCRVTVVDNLDEETESTEDEVIDTDEEITDEATEEDVEDTADEVSDGITDTEEATDSSASDNEADAEDTNVVQNLVTGLGTLIDNIFGN